MKKLLSVVSVMLAAASVCACVSCGGRTKKDLSSATSLADLNGAVLGAHWNTCTGKAAPRMRTMNFICPKRN